jgi:hypothetical protein
MFHLDYLSCFFTVLATILLARKSWIGLLIAIANSLIVCAIGFRTSQLGFIPANLFCVCVYAFSMRSWRREKTHSNRDPAQRQDSGSIADAHRMSPAMQHRTAAGTRRFPSDLTKSTAIKTTIDAFTCLDPTRRAAKPTLEMVLQRIHPDGSDLVQKTLVRPNKELRNGYFRSDRFEYQIRPRVDHETTRK